MSCDGDAALPCDGLCYIQDRPLVDDLGKYD